MKKRSGTRCGYGVHFVDNIIPDISEPFYDELGPTNNKAELYAIYEAIRQVIDRKLEFDKFIIKTDSEYCSKIFNIWIHSWKKNGWINSKNKPVENQHIIKKIDELIMSEKGKIKIMWVKGHSDEETEDAYGNAQADKLARNGANRY